MSATRSLLEALPDGLVAVDARARVRLLNAAAEEILETSRASAIGVRLARVGPAGEAMAPAVERAIAEERVVREPAVRWLGRLGAARGAELAAAPRIGAKGAVVLLRDVADPLELLAGAQPYATLGAGVAHEVRNPLGGIRGAMQLLDAELDSGGPLREHVRVALREVDRLSALTERLLDLGRPSPEVRAPLNLHKVLDDAVALASRSPKARGLTFERGYDPSLPPIRGDADALHRMFLNLLENAIQASPPGGRVTITTGVELGRARGGGQLLRAAITDDGPGVPPEVEARLFLPFATAKPGGTGLGLALARKVALDHGGSLAYAREPGRGASFVARLPAEEPG